MEGILRKLLERIPYVRSLSQELRRRESLQRFPPGHYYSPIVNWPEIKDSQNIWQISEPKDIDLNAEGQLSLFRELLTFYNDIPWGAERKTGLRYYFNNNFYSYSDAIILYSMIRLKHPRKILEIGSGFSSAVMLDTNQFFMKDKIALQFVEPYPERLLSLFAAKDHEKQMVKKEDVQKIPLLQFKQLEPGDFLVVDSSHVSKTGSDVNYILFEILPILKKGVFIHFHDIFYPFEYPKLWAYQGRNWNEAYLLRAFLMNNSNYKILMFSDFLLRSFPEVFSGMPLYEKNTGANLWLEKL